MSNKHETERVSRLASWEAEPEPPPRRVNLPPVSESRIEFPSWLEESDLREALERVDDRGGTALPPGLVDLPRPPTPPAGQRPAPRPAPVAPPRGRPQPPRRLVEPPAKPARPGRPPAEPARPGRPTGKRPTAQRPTIQLLLRKNGELIGRRTFAQAKISIGRGKRCVLRLDDPTVSRHHAQIVQRGDAFVLEDVQSCNGVKVNGHLTERRRLEDRDVIALGEHELHVILGRVPLDAVPEQEPAPALLPDDDDDATESDDDPCLQTVFGRTARWRKRDVFDADQAERSVNSRAFLQIDPGANRLWPKTCQVVLERDVFLIGGGEEADLRVLAFWVPRVAGVIVRGPSGFSLAPVSYWSAAVRLNGEPVWSTQRLEARDVITIAGQSLTFMPGMPRGGA